jgi:hypothetical protein
MIKRRYYFVERSFIRRRPPSIQNPRSSENFRSGTHGEEVLDRTLAAQIKRLEKLNHWSSVLIFPKDTAFISYHTTPHVYFLQLYHIKTIQTYLAPNPPGNNTTSTSSGASANVCVGTILALKALPCTVCAAFCVGTGSSVAAMMESWRGCWRARSEKASRGPVASRSWKPGKRMRAIFVGSGVVVVV